MVGEKRRERRLKVSLPIKISYRGGPEVYSQTENISRLGTYAEIEQQIPLGAHLDITIEIPAYTNDSSLAGNIKCRGDVFRCNLIREIESKRIYGLGIFFTDFPDEQDRNKLSKYVDFLILKEQEDIKQGIQRWRRKRRRK
jgi:hypothetical protein